MRILFLPSSYPPEIGGIETAAQHLVDGLRARGHRVMVVANRDRSATADRGEDAVAIDFPAPQFTPTGLARYVARLPEIPRSLGGFRPDVSIVFGISNQAQVALWQRLRHRTPIVTWTHGEILNDADDIHGTSIFYRTLVGALARRSLVWVSPSAHLLDELATHGIASPARTTVIANAIDTSVWRALPPPTPGERLRVGAWGRFVDVKGFDRLCECVGACDPERVQLWIAGDGPRRPELEARFGRRVSFLGPLDGAAIHRRLADTDVVAAPSRREAFGLSALEAAASGRPVLHDGRTAIGDAVGAAGVVVDFDPASFPQQLAAALPIAPFDPGRLRRDWREVAAETDGLLAGLGTSVARSGDRSTPRT